jgi:hypothetical protein
MFLSENLFLSSNPSKLYFISNFTSSGRSCLDWSKFEWIWICSKLFESYLNWFETFEWNSNPALTPPTDTVLRGPTGQPPPPSPIWTRRPRRPPISLHAVVALKPPFPSHRCRRPLEKGLCQHCTMSPPPLPCHLPPNSSAREPLRPSPTCCSCRLAEVHRNLIRTPPPPRAHGANHRCMSFIPHHPDQPS